MPASLLEPRDAGTLGIDISVEFEDDLASVHGDQECLTTCKRTVCSINPCCYSINVVE
jgi:hypothetical protein